MIYLVSATVRPLEFKKTESIWRKKSQNKENILTKVIVDNETDKKILGKKFDCMVYGMDGHGITKPLTRLTHSLLGNIRNDDIVVVVSDDFTPPDNWDTYLFDFFKEKKGALSVKIDGLDDGGRNSIVSLPIMDGETLKKLNGYIYHPAYCHLFSDNELYDNLRFLNCLHIENRLESPLFKHVHWTTSGREKDKIDLRNHKNYQKDKQEYEKRKKLKFNDRVKIRPILSVLICSLKDRSEQLNNLILRLNNQIANKNVEIKICIDNGEHTIPKKRNYLINSSLGEYICFVDDDDDVSNNYIDLILESLIDKPDCVGIIGMYYANNVRGKDFIHSIKYSEWRDVGEVYERTPNHLNPIKSEHIFKIGGFNETLKRGEDFDFSQRVKHLLKTEKFIDKPIYKYNFINYVRKKYH